MAQKRSNIMAYVVAAIAVAAIILLLTLERRRAAAHPITIETVAEPIDAPLPLSPAQNLCGDTIKSQNKKATKAAKETKAEKTAKGSRPAKTKHTMELRSPLDEPVPSELQ